MPKTDLPSPEYLRQRLRYEPETGKLYWRAHPDMPASWNTRWAGREALTSISTRGYRRGTLDNRRYYAHRVIWAMERGAWPLDAIDHEDHDKTNNREGNLRPATDADNAKNASRSAANTSGVTGVRWNKKDRCWHARIGINRKYVHLGSFHVFEEAARVRKAAEFAYGFHPNHGAIRP